MIYHVFVFFTENNNCRNRWHERKVVILKTIIFVAESHYLDEMENSPAINCINFRIQVSFRLFTTYKLLKLLFTQKFVKTNSFCKPYWIILCVTDVPSIPYHTDQRKPRDLLLFNRFVFFRHWLMVYIGQQDNGDSINCFIFCFCFHSRAKAIEWVWRVAWIHFHFEWRPGLFFVIISQANEEPLRFVFVPKWIRQLQHWVQMFPVLRLNKNYTF